MNGSELELKLLKTLDNNSLITLKKLVEENPSVDLSFGDNDMIIEAARLGRISIVKYLLTRTEVNPADCSDFAIYLAAANGKFRVVQLLLKDKRVDPAADNNAALRVARKNKHANTVKLLLKNKRVHKAEVMLGVEKLISTISKQSKANQPADRQSTRVVENYPPLRLVK